MTLWMAALGAALSRAAVPESTAVIPAVVLKVEGTGIANVRKHSGIMEAAGVRGKVYPGDKVLTDSRSAVSLLLADGSILKIGFNSELALDSVQTHDRFLAWSFSLPRGIVRALVEKIPSDDVHVRIGTPAGTASVRGTELMLAYDEAAGSSRLYALEGVVSFGAPGCEKAKSCVEVRGGESSSMVKDGKAPTKAKAIDVKELLGAAEARLSVFRDAQSALLSKSAPTDEAVLRKLLADASREMAEGQDRAIGRSKEDREAMHTMLRDGRLKNVLAAADAYASAKGIFEAASNGGAENFVAPVLAAKFRLGQAVIGADTAGLFTDKSAGAVSSDWTGRTFKERKTIDFELTEGAKALNKELEQAAVDYRDTLIYAEAFDASQFEPPGKPSAAQKIRCDQACLERRIDHEVDVASEGSGAAFAGKAPEEPSKAMASKKGRGGIPDLVVTKHFSRTVPGDGCFATLKSCKTMPCASAPKVQRGAKCAAGDMVEVCDGRVIPVRCPEKP